MLLQTPEPLARVDWTTAHMNLAEILSHISWLVQGLVGMLESWLWCLQEPEGMRVTLYTWSTMRCWFGVSVSQIYNSGAGGGFMRDLLTWKHSALWERCFPVLTWGPACAECQWWTWGEKRMTSQTLTTSPEACSEQISGLLGALGTLLSGGDWYNSGSWCGGLWSVFIKCTNPSSKLWGEDVCSGFVAVVVF